MNKVILGNNKEVLKTLADNSIDSIVTDPPYELGFMGKKWDNTGIAYDVGLWQECLRVLKPGGHLLAFSGTRTYHRMAVAIEDAGFEVRDMIEWVYGSGFPKSLNIGKAVDKLQGNEREVEIVKGKIFTGSNNNINGEAGEYEVTKGTSPYEGWGTALKPAHEPICMARKPLSEKNVALNVLKWGTGGIDIDGSRVEGEMGVDRALGKPRIDTDKYGKANSTLNPQSPLGRFPSNLIHDGSDEVKACFPETGKGGYPKLTKDFTGQSNITFRTPEEREERINLDSGNASRFFKSIIYQAKASKSERNRGCEGLEEKEGIRTNAPRGNEDAKTPIRANNHPTVKPIALMAYLIKIVTPKGGVVLDPFAGSGSTLVAAKEEGFEYIGIDITLEYIEIINARLAAVTAQQKLF